MASNQQCKTFIAQIAPIIQKVAKERGYLICSTVIAQACVEDAYGTSILGKNYHNYFGMKCGSAWKGKSVNLRTKEEYTVGTHTVIKDAFRAFDNIEQCVFNFYELLNTSLYKGVQSGVDYKTQMSQIKKCGYMTSSTEVNSVINRINKYDLTKYDNISVSVEKSYVVGTIYTTSQDLYIREQPLGKKMKFECITQNAKKHAFFDDYGNAILKKGTRVTCKAISKQTNSIWILIPSGWICARNSKDIYIV